ncbi:hypothetical protein E6W99_15715 [Metabacillus sediminilitoris]|uniref:Uncharacterized protein n=2 Tax=Metabacillus sediminilitoris TaxID=2567941 RepID=A0A4S4BUI9_9BACI|nr:hypothetical protein E6W99_15715 [Metabacillus sediminilitoris]
MEAMISASIDITNKHYYQVFPILFSIASITVISDWILSYFKYKNVPITIENKSEISIKKVSKKIIEMVFILIIFIICVSFLQNVLNKGFLFSFVLVIIPISIICAIAVWLIAARGCSLSAPSLKGA